MKPLCLIPWTSIDIGLGGTMAPCCKFRAQVRAQNKNYNSLNINKNTISQYASSDYLNAIKQDMLKNEWPEGCSRCRIEEESNIKSKRILDYERWPEEFDNYTPEMGFIIASIIFGNTCNLKCITCKSVASSRWRKEYKELYGVDIPHDEFITVTCDNILVDSDVILVSDDVPVSSDKENWTLSRNVDESTFDFSWHPSPTDSPYIYKFGTQWQKDGGAVYKVEGATKTKYLDVPRAKALPTTEHWHTDTSVVSADNVKHTSDIKYGWKLQEDTDYSNFDLSWHPDPAEKPYTYVFPSQWQRDSGTHYITEPGAPKKYVNDQVTSPLPNKEDWLIPENIDEDSFDFSWLPDPDDPPYIYVFGTQWQKDGGPV